GFSAATANPQNNHDVSGWNLSVVSRPDLLPVSGASVASLAASEQPEAISVRLLPGSTPLTLEVRFRGTPHVVYSIQACSDPALSTWQTIGSMEADDAGEFRLQEPCDQNLR